MPNHFTLANDQVTALLAAVKQKHHSPRLDQAEIVVCFDESKPFKKGKFNWGKVVKFSPLNKMFQGHKKYDFLLILPTDGWFEVVTGKEREAWLDLLLARCQAEYMPQYEDEGGEGADDEDTPKKKKKVKKDVWGRVEYSDEMKYDEDGNPIWKVSPLDIQVFSANAKRYGLWCEDYETFKEAVSQPGHFEPEPEPAAHGFQGRLIANADYSFSPNLPDEPEVSDAALMELAAQ